MSSCPCTVALRKQLRSDVSSKSSWSIFVIHPGVGMTLAAIGHKVGLPVQCKAADKGRGCDLRCTFRRKQPANVHCNNGRSLSSRSMGRGARHFDERHMVSAIKPSSSTDEEIGATEPLLVFSRPHLCLLVCVSMFVAVCGSPLGGISRQKA